MPTIVSMNEAASSPPLWPGAWKPNETEPTAAESHIPDKSDRLSSRCASRNFARQIVGRSSALREVLKQVEIVAPTNTSVLIHGETGTGKELIAQAVHELSRRRNHALVKINCAAIPSGLLESELFGHERGAFTGALTRKIGRVELAHQGTLFLDEIGDIPLELQPKLLRVLQEREFERLGGTQIQKVNIRLVVASSRDLSQMVAEHQFRSDLYYRLNVFPVRLPALRDRGGDLKLLVWHFVKKFSDQMDKHIDTVPPQVLDDLTRYHWPGNIRELQNVIERAVILSPGNLLKLSRAELVHESERQPVAHSTNGSSKTATLSECEREHILQTLEATHWIVGGPSGAAVLLGLKRTTLLSKMQKLGISRKTKLPQQSSLATAAAD